MLAEAEAGEGEVHDVDLVEQGPCDRQLVRPVLQECVHAKVQILVVSHMDHGIPELNVLLGNFLPEVPPSLGAL